MGVKKIIKEKSVKVTNNGMITIPAVFRRRYNLTDGDRVLVLEDEGALRIIPIRSDAELRKDSYTKEEMKNLSKAIRNEELARESE
ncbi:MAG: AbrB/MazE/SpoVT family DNA-binding domain-containing protein [Promethearchaeota archaeon]|nr:MAG: AbrB/MazE/SpoVT family DNA-binding domain-containing protein [Candidatus Lokiarchaeota archaeon]